MSSSSGINLETRQIPLHEIIRATQNFSPDTLVGYGAFGMVYKGKLPSHYADCQVAIKRLRKNDYQGYNNFVKELKLVSSFNHPNIIRFVGYCDEANEKIIVSEYATNNSLDNHLADEDKRRCLTWAQRLEICLGAAEGIKYLHSGLGEHRRVIHRDVKSGNILLDDNFEAKICDFGLSIFGPRNQTDTHVRTRLAGTDFYVDPIYYQRKMLSKESDIYSFGVVMFEMSSGTMAYRQDAENQYLIDRVQRYYDDHKDVYGHDNLMDPVIKGHNSRMSFVIFNAIAHECISLDGRKRPSIDRLIKTIGEAKHIQSYGIPEGLDSASYSDAYWKPLLPPDYLELIKRAVPKLEIQSEKELYIYLSTSHIFLDSGYLSFQLDKESGKKCYMLGAKQLKIENDVPKKWNWESRRESRFPMVAILESVHWLEIRGNIKAESLSRNTRYAAYLVFKTTGDSRSLAVPARARVKYGGIEMETENVYLRKPDEATVEITGHVAALEENNVFPHERKDGWMEIELGEFECHEGNNGNVKMRFREKNTEIEKKGLIVEGIELRPK